MKKYFFLLVFSFYYLFGFTQTSDYKLNYGIYLGIFKPILISPIELTENASIENGYGFSTGILMEYPFSHLISVSPKTGISFGDSKVKFLEDNIDDYFLMQFTFDLSIDFNIELSNSKTAPYFFIGAKYVYPFQNNDLGLDELDDKSNYSLELGFGIEKLIVNKFIIAPELKYSNGLTNLNAHPKLTKLKYHSLSLLLNFKGMDKSILR